MNCSVSHRFRLALDAAADGNVCEETNRDGSLTNKGPQNGDTMTIHGQGVGHMRQPQGEARQPEEPQSRSFLPCSLIGRKRMHSGDTVAVTAPIHVCA